MLSLVDLIKYVDLKYNCTSTGTGADIGIGLSKEVESIVSFKTTNHAYSNVSIFEQLLFCLYDNNSSENMIICEGTYDIYDREYVRLNQQILSNIKLKMLAEINESQNSIILMMNKKKMIQLINTNEFNHELILLYCIIYNVNIYVHYYDMNLYKVYYPELKLHTCKKNIFVQYGCGKYASTNTFQQMTIDNNNILKWATIQNHVNKNETLMYAIYFAFLPEEYKNKKFETTDEIISMVQNDAGIVYDKNLNGTIFKHRSIISLFKF